MTRRHRSANSSWMMFSSISLGTYPPLSRPPRWLFSTARQYHCQNHKYNQNRHAHPHPYQSVAARLAIPFRLLIRLLIVFRLLIRPHLDPARLLMAIATRYARNSTRTTTASMASHNSTAPFQSSPVTDVRPPAR